MERRRYLLSCLSAQFRAKVFNYLYNNLVPDTLDGHSVRNQGKDKMFVIEGNGEIVNQLINPDKYRVISEGKVITTKEGNSLRVVVDTTSGATNTALYIDNSTQFIASHKYFMLVKNLPSGCRIGVNYNGSYANTIFTNVAENYLISCYFPADLQVNFLLEIEIIDLTKRYGTGNEPTSIYDNRIKKIIADGYKPKNEGTYKCSVIDSIQTRGFNICDEEFVVVSGHLESANYNKCLPNEDYYFMGRTDITPQLFGNGVKWYDKDKNRIQTNYINGKALITSPSNAEYFKLGLATNYGTTYNHDICVSRVNNAWDEEWEVGNFNTTPSSPNYGQKESSTTNIRSKNYTKVISNTTYYIQSGSANGFVLFYDKSQQALSHYYFNSSSSFTTPSNCEYIMFYLGVSYGTTYNHDIAIFQLRGYVPSRWQDFYQRVEYIESSGTQYVDTGFAPSYNTEVVATFVKTTNAGVNQAIFGGQTGSSNRFMFAISNQEKIAWQFGSNDTGHLNTIDANTKYVIKNVGGSLYLDGTLIYTADTQSFVGTYNAYLFARNQIGTTNNYAYIKLYSCKIYDNGTLIRDFIPVYRKSDMTIGLYDTVNGKFYTNAGTGTFLKGSDIQNDNVIKLPAPLSLDGVISAHNRFEPTSTGFVFTRNVSMVDLGSLNYTADHGNTRFYSTGLQSVIKYPSTNAEVPNILCSKYVAVGNYQVSNGVNGISVSTAGAVTVTDIGHENDDATTFKTAMSGVPFYYQLATPQVIRIPRKHLGVVKLKDLNWSSSGNDRYYTSDLSALLKNRYNYSVAPTNIFSSNFFVVSWSNLLSNLPNNSMSYNDVNAVSIVRKGYGNNATNFKNSLTEYDILFYETENEVEDFLLPKQTLPDLYQRVEYIESTGTEYIDTLLAGTNGYTFETKVIYTSFPNTYTYLAGFGSSSTNRIYFTRVQSGSTDGYTFTNAINLTSASVSANTEYTYVSTMKTGEQTLYRNGTLIGSGSLTNVNEYSTIWLFTSNYEGNPNGSVACKMYYARFYYNGVLVRNFIPCYRKSDNTAGLYDTIHNVFYTNAGTGTFKVGNNIYENINEEVFQRGGNVMSYEFSWVENQILQNGNFESANGWNTNDATFSVSNNVATFTASAQNGYIQTVVNYISTHIYLIIAQVKLTTGTTLVALRSGGSNKAYTKSTTDWQTLYGFMTNYNGGASIVIRDERTSDWDAIQVRNAQLIDLTDGFPTDTPTSVSDPRIQEIIEKGYIPTNTSGTLKDVETECLANVGLKIQVK